MFINFFDSLRAKGLRVTLGEWLTLQKALDQGLCGSSLTQFYHVARMILVKSETDFDKFDMAFEECFKAAQKETEVGAQMLRWLDKSDMMELAHEEAQPLKPDGGHPCGQGTGGGDFQAKAERPERGTQRGKFLDRYHGQDLFWQYGRQCGGRTGWR